MRKTYVYSDLLNDDFAENGISPKPLRKDYVYQRNGIFWRLARFLIYDIIARPLVYLYTKLVFAQRFENREALKKVKGGYYIIANHTGSTLDAFCPNILDFSKDNSVVVGPHAMSVKGLENILYLVGAIPKGSDITQMMKMKSCIKERVARGETVTIYPEGHIWPYYTDIRPFTEDSFIFPASDGKPVFTFTNCYEKRALFDFPKVVTYIDGPFFPDTSLSARERRRELRDVCYSAMKERADKYSMYEYARYIDAETAEKQIKNTEEEYENEKCREI